MSSREELKNKADAVNRAAIDVLEDRGFTFSVHFGYANAASRLWAMDQAMSQGYLYEHLASTFGPLL